MFDWLSYFTFGETGWGNELFAGFLITCQLAITTLPVGLVIGLVVASLALSKNWLLRTVARGYTTAFRGIPELLTLFVVFNGASLLLNKASRWISPDSGYVELSPFIAGVVALGLVFGAFAGEVFRGAIQALDRGQMEAGFASGMSRWLVFRRIMLPQIWRFALPGLGNLWLSLVKDTALVSIIALDDLMRMTNVAVHFTKEPFIFYLAACLIYWMTCLLSEQVLAFMENRANRGVRRLST